MTSPAHRAALDHVLDLILALPWSDTLVLRGSRLMRVWAGDLAREPADLDFVVLPDLSVPIDPLDPYPHVPGFDIVQQWPESADGAGRYEIWKDGDDEFDTRGTRAVVPPEGLRWDLEPDYSGFVSRYRYDLVEQGTTIRSPVRCPCGDTPATRQPPLAASGPALPRRRCGWFNASMTERAWPEDWADRMAGKDCPLCGVLGEGDNDHTVMVYTGDVAEVHLERRTRLPGYCIVIWRLGHVAEPTDLDPEQASRYWTDVMATGRAVQARFNPIKMNYMTLGNTVPHLHTHVLPRYRDDSAPAGPIPWQDIFSTDPVPDEDLHRQAADLRALLAR